MTDRMKIFFKKANYATIYLLVITFSLFQVSCRVERNVSNNPNYQFGYRVGQIYETRVHTIFWTPASPNSSNHITPLLDFQNPDDYEDDEWNKLLPPRIRVRITKIVLISDPVNGKRLRIYGVCLNGKFSEQKVLLNLISKKESYTGNKYEVPDPDFLKLVKGVE